MLQEGISIIICCYNSAITIDETLKHIARQHQVNIPSEVIIVDNACTDNTVEVAKSAWLKNGNDHIQFKIIFEQKPGLAYARQKGINEAHFEFLVFCDDDNWLDKNYLQTVAKFFISNPELAVLGGLGTAEFEKPSLKPHWFDALFHGYAVGPQAEKEGLVNGVYGAGICIRRSVMIDILHLPLLLHGRKQNHLSSGEDSEICLRIMLSGYKILYSPQLKFTHFLSASRLSWEHLKRLHIGLAQSNVIINLYQRALFSNDARLPYLYWLKKGLYYCGIYLKYWPKHFSNYRRHEGTIDEIHHLTWKYIAFSYFRYNFKTVKIYDKIFSLKKAYV